MTFAEDGVLKLWDMVTGEELMTKAITQTTKDSALRIVRRLQLLLRRSTWYS